MRRSCPFRISRLGHTHRPCTPEKAQRLPSKFPSGECHSYDEGKEIRSRLTSFMRATHLTCKCFRSNASWSNPTTSLLTAFLRSESLCPREENALIECRLFDRE